MEIGEKIMSIQTTAILWEESRKFEEICCHSDACEIPPANPDMKNSQGVLGMSARNSDKKNPRKQTKMIKQKKDAGIMRTIKEKTTHEKLTIQLKEINQKVLAKEWRLKKYRQRVKQNRQNRTFQNNGRKFYQQLGGDYNKKYQQPDAKDTQRCWTKIWQPKNITRRLNE